MTTHRLPSVAARVAACAIACAAQVALAQPSLPPTAADVPASGASAPAAARPVGPRLRSPAETGNRATVPGDLRPERPVTPQISIPFGKSPPPPSKREERVTKRNTAASGGSVDDAVARCESQVDDNVRAACRAKLTRESKSRLPN
jgi:hypothetical protein